MAEHPSPPQTAPLETVPVECERIAVAFARVLRGSGLDIPVGKTALYARALAITGMAERDTVYWTGHAVFVERPEDRDCYDRAFRAFHERRVVDLFAADEPTPTEVILAFDTDEERETEGVAANDDGAPVFAVRWSATEVLRERDFARYTDAEFAEARRLMHDLRTTGALRPSRRHRRSRARRGHPDLRRTVRMALTTGGEPVRRAHSVPARQPRRVVLLLDVSGSMEPYARAFVRFLHAAVAGRTRVEAFALGTRLTRITRELSTRDPDAAIADAARRVHDWSGGTRIGECLRTFNDEWGVRGMARGAVVVVLSDGWDRGEPELLAEQMARLRRVAFRIVWANPLKASPGYAPLARGMAAALDHVDEFVEGHSLAALERLAEAIAAP